MPPEAMVAPIEVVTIDMEATTTAKIEAVAKEALVIDEGVDASTKDMAVPLRAIELELRGH